MAGSCVVDGDEGGFDSFFDGHNRLLDPSSWTLWVYHGYTQMSMGNLGWVKQRVDRGELPIPVDNRGKRGKVDGIMIRTI